MASGLARAHASPAPDDFPPFQSRDPIRHTYKGSWVGLVLKKCTLSVMVALSAVAFSLGVCTALQACFALLFV